MKHNITIGELANLAKQSLYNDLKQQPMREVIRIDQEEKKDEKPLQLTHCWVHGTWCEGLTINADYDNIILRGSKDGVDYFLAWNDGIDFEHGFCSLGMYKGHLNSGKY